MPIDATLEDNVADELDDQSTLDMIEIVLRKVIVNECLAAPDPLVAGDAWANWLKGWSDDLARRALAPDINPTIIAGAIRTAGEFDRFSDDLRADVAEAIEQSR